MTVLSFDQMGQVSTPVSQTVEGVSVETSVWTADNARLSIVQLQFTSQRDDAVTVRLTDDVPDGIPLDDIGPHPKYGGDKWRKSEDGSVVFTDVLDPEGTSFTIFGAKGLDSTQVESFLIDPVVEVTPVGDAATSDTHSEPMTSDQSTTDDESTDDHSDSEGGDFDDLIPNVEDVERPGRGEFGHSGHSSTGGGNADELRFIGTETRSVDDQRSNVTDGGSSDTIELEDPTETVEDTEASLTEEEATETAEEEAIETAEVEALETTDESNEIEVDTMETTTEDESEDASASKLESASDSESDLHSEPESSSDADADSPTDSDSVVEAESGSTVESASDSTRESVVSAFVAELSDQELDADDASLIRESLGLSASNSMEARLRNVQNRMNDLAVYTDALEEFIDENGTAEQLLSDLQDDTDEMRRDVNELDEALSATNAAVELLEQQVDALEDRAVSESSFEARLAELDEKFAEESSLHDELATLTDELSEVRSEVERGAAWRSKMSQAAQISDGETAAAAEPGDDEVTTE